MTVKLCKSESVQCGRAWMVAVLRDGRENIRAGWESGVLLFEDSLSSPEKNRM